ncbi:MAG: serine/threonine-protein phosphatase, partial [bacterium]|nr:serine/threonine-protein phosphatase [bacterium]
GEFRIANGERLLIVADGMGGHAGGVTASRLCIESAARVFESGEGSAGERVSRGLEEANRAVYAASEADPSLRGMGTTGVALLFEPSGTVSLAWVGDSRAYRFRNGQLEQLSDDHSLVADWVRLGRITEEEAETHPRRNELLRAIGPDPSVEVDRKSYTVEPGDIYLLCSDGLCGYLSAAEISAVVGFNRPENAVRLLVDKVNVERNSPDNVTVQIMEVPNDIATAADTTAPGGGAVRDDEYRAQASGDRGGSDDVAYPRTKRTVAV